MFPGFGFPDPDRNILAESGEKPKNALIGKTGKVPSHQLRNIGLRQSHQFGSLRLRQSLFPDEACNTDNQIGLQQADVRVGNAEVRKNVIAAFCADWSFNLCPPW